METSSHTNGHQEMETTSHTSGNQEKVFTPATKWTCPTTLIVDRKDQIHLQLLRRLRSFEMWTGLLFMILWLHQLSNVLSSSLFLSQLDKLVWQTSTVLLAQLCPHGPALFWGSSSVPVVQLCSDGPVLSWGPAGLCGEGHQPWITAVRISLRLVQDLPDVSSPSLLDWTTLLFSSSHLYYFISLFHSTDGSVQQLHTHKPSHTSTSANEGYILHLYFW